jgi:beta-lactamase superfamily II metal-dependent hydrolase
MNALLITWLLLLVLPSAHSGGAGEDAAEIIFLDVGQGDAAIVRSPEGKVALVDSGRDAEILESLSRHGIESVDIAIASHPHADHIGGLEAVLRSMPVGYYMDNGIPHTTATYSNLMRTLQNSGITYIEATVRTLSLGSVSLSVLPPPAVDGDNLNNGSIGLLVTYGSFKALLTGDSEIEELNHFLSLGVPEVTVLKAAHHGSRDAVSPAWLSATKPDVVVISCGRENQYGYPNSWALRYYETVASEVYRTDLDGDVMIRVLPDGSFDVSTQLNRNAGR